jgi:glycosyltransferase involved in cell wall biosynthesis
MKKPSKILIIAGGGIGGTEKCATVFAEILCKRGYEVGFVSAPGPRIQLLKERGIVIFPPQDSPESLAGCIRSFNPDVIHQHVPGYEFGNVLYRALDIFGSKQIKLIETNVFGRLEDPAGWEKVDFRLFISLASGVQALKRSGIPFDDKFKRKHTVIYYPVFRNKKILDTIGSREIRRELGVGDDEILFYRIGQPGKKWEMWEYEAFLHIRRAVPKARLLVMEPPGKLRKKMESDAGTSGLIIREVTNDFSWLERLNCAADIAIHASAWGESYGYTIAEAMAAGKPVITRSTPWGDNAQVELVENGKTGFVCLSVGEMARRGIELAHDPELRRRMGEAGMRRIIKISDPEQEADMLESVIRFLAGQGTSSLLLKRLELFQEFTKNFSALEYSFSEKIQNHPLEKAYALSFMLYKCTRSYLRNLKGSMKTKLT